jgi:CheY-like chemotaxis protein
MTLSQTILHVDDDANDVLLFKHACRKGGVAANVQTVCDGEEAVAYLQGNEQFSDRAEHPLPDLILLDLKMPRLNGFDVLHWLRQEAHFRRVPVVVLTSSNRDADVKRAYELGANSYLIKPVGLEALMEVARAIQHYWLKLNELPSPSDA